MALHHSLSLAGDGDVRGSIQPHGALLALTGPQGMISHASANTRTVLGIDTEQLLGSRLNQLFSAGDVNSLEEGLEKLLADENPLYISTVTVMRTGEGFYASAHRSGDAFVIELERCETGQSGSFLSLYPLVSSFRARLRKASPVNEIAQIATEEVRRASGFDRVLVYKFDEAWNGHVIAESLEPNMGDSNMGDSNMAPFLDLWFPASDIPQETRSLYELNRLRLIADANYEPVPLIPADPERDKPFDLSQATLRSIPLVHLEYLRNMGVASSMSMPLLADDGRLWGLLACHHRAPRVVPLEVRTGCEVLAQMLAAQVEMAEQRAIYQQHLRLTSLTTRLLGFMAAEEYFIDGLTKHPDELLEFAEATGVAVLHQNQATLMGSCPPKEDILRLADWLVERGRQEIFHTDCLLQAIPEGERYREYASGLLAVSISKLYRSHILWFRPEITRTVNWAGDPDSPAADPSGMRRRPRSFESWKQTVSGRSVPWRPAQVQAAGELRNAVIGIVLRKAEELAELIAEVQRSNKELESFSYSVSHDLRAPFRHIIGYSELLKESKALDPASKERRYIDVIAQSARYAGTLVDNLLSFSQMGRAKLRPTRVDMGQVVHDVVTDLEIEMSGRDIEVEVGDLPPVEGDAMMLRLVWQNLLQNAVKYTRKREHASIEIRAEKCDSETIFSVRDNGVGFEQAYVDKLFGVFQRLHRIEDFEGTGIGLANVRRIISRHGGRTWAEGQVDKGAVFYFSVPDKLNAE